MIITDTNSGATYTWPADRDQITADYTDAPADVTEALDAAFEDLDSALEDSTHYDYLGWEVSLPEADEGDAFHDELRKGVWRQRDAEWGNPGTPALTVGNIAIVVPTEFFKGDKLKKWPTSKHFYLALTAPDGHKTMLDTSSGSWAGALADVRLEQTRYERRQHTQHLALDEAAKIFAVAEAEYRAAEAAYHETIRAASAAGVSNYKIAQRTGITQPRVARILKK